MLALVADDAHDVNLSAIVVNGITHGFAVDGQAFVGCAVLGIPLLERSIQFYGIDSNQYVTYGAFAGDTVFSVTVVTAKSGTSRGR